MRALVYGGPGLKEWKEVPDPKILKATDAIVKVETTTICGTDLHILKGDVATVIPGRILGHEGVGTITEVGTSVANFSVGDRVIISCIKSCGACANCKQGLYSHCLGDESVSGLGWVLGHLIDGTQAEFVRIPYADNSLHKMPAGTSDIEGVMLSDILPTGFEMGIQYGTVKPGDVVAVIGTGPVGLAAIATANLYGASRVIAIDLDTNRLEKSWPEITKKEGSPYKLESFSLSFYSKANLGIKLKVDKKPPRLALHRAVFLWSLHSSAVRQQNVRLDQGQELAKSMGLILDNGKTIRAGGWQE